LGEKGGRAKMNDILNLYRRFRNDLRRLCATRPRAVVLAVGVCILGLVFGISKASEVNRRIIHVEREGAFKGQRILGDSTSSVYEAKERSFAKTTSELLAGQKTMADDLKKLTDKVDGMEPPSKDGEGAVATGANVNPTASAQPIQNGSGSEVGVASQAAPENFSLSRINPEGIATNGSSGLSSGLGLAPTQKRAARGPSVISFPVKDDGLKEEIGIVLPPGSYVKAKLLTGVEAPEGRPYPVLVQLDYANVLPNRHKLDLSGCFMIIKAQGDLSIERVQMQATKLSCVGKNGRMFEKDINGFVVDDQDNSLAVTGEVNSKQDRVAAMAFLSSVVEGVGKAIQQAQTTQQTTPLGGSQTVLTGDEKKYMVAGGASNAAGTVTQWYLKQAENLLPTIKVGSGHDIWVVLQESVNLPKSYFKKGGGNEARYEYVTRIIE
jgi:conjugal transfer pilus assembly protein TraB